MCDSKTLAISPTHEAHTRLLTQALIEYAERYGLTDLARQALRQPDPVVLVLRPSGKGGGTRS